eukprot:3988813-Amphidinium_carterae.3
MRTVHGGTSGFEAAVLACSKGLARRRRATKCVHLWGGGEPWRGPGICSDAVSYTHLTLPTILLV